MVRPFAKVLAMLLLGSQGAAVADEPAQVAAPAEPAPAPSADPASEPSAEPSTRPVLMEDTTPAIAADPEPSRDPIEDSTGPIRKRNASLRRVFKGPFQSSRLFAMPTADTIGPYMLSFGGDGSLLQETGVLTSAGVLAIGFGDLAQLEYRHTSAISITGVNAPVPGVGVQLKLPIPDINGVPAIGVSFRLGVPRREEMGATDIDETVTDLYLVGRLRIKQLSWLALHGGTRISSAKMVLSGDRTGEAKKTLWLPTAGYEIAMNPTAKIVGEVALAPQFRWTPGTDEAPEIGYGLLGRFGMRWALLPSVVIDGSIGYQLEVANAALASGPDAVVAWDIRLGAEVFVPWGALACRAAGVFCE